MQIKLNKLKNKLYVFILFTTLFKIFSTSFLYAGSFEVKNTQISKQFDINFNKNLVIDKGFKLAFDDLILRIIKSQDYLKINNTSLKNIKSMIDTFSIKEEKFVDDFYYVNIDVSFNKKKIYLYLEKQNIFPSLPKIKKLLFIPILINENNNEIVLFTENIFYNKWLNEKKSHSQLDYILPVDDLDDIRIIKEKFNFIEDYDFKEIIDKYSINSYIIALIYKSGSQYKVLSKIELNGELIIDNRKFEMIDLTENKKTENIIESLKVIYEDYWKEENQINTSIKLPLIVSIESKKQKKIDKFENSLSQLDLVSNFFIYKFDNQNVYYRIIFNGTPKIFISRMADLGHQIDIQNETWKLK